jgi:hypothetical protein
MAQKITIKSKKNTSFSVLHKGSLIPFEGATEYKISLLDSSLREHFN